MLDTRMKSFNRALVTALFFFCFMTSAPRADDGFYRLWWNEEKDGIFELLETERGIEGITRWGKKPMVDSKNPDETLRDRDLKGITFLWGFEYDEKKNIWKDGKVYDPNSGKTYSAKLQLIDGGKRLKMRGYVGVSLFGRTAKFDPVSAADVPPSLMPTAPDQAKTNTSSQ